MYLLQDGHFSPMHRHTPGVAVLNVIDATVSTEIWRFGTFAGVFLYIRRWNKYTLSILRGAWAIFPGAQPTEQPRRDPGGG